MFLIVIGILFVLFVIECLLTEVEHWGWATATLIGSVVAAQVFHVADVWGYITHNGVQTLLLVLGYLVAGVVWSFIKWFSFLMKFRDEYRSIKASWLEKNGIPQDQALTIEQAEHLRRYLADRWTHTFYGNSFAEKPKAAKNKRRITAWMSFWPFSLAGTLINDPIRRLFTWLFNTLKAGYQKVSDHVFRNDDLN